MTESEIAGLKAKLEMLHADLGEMKGIMKEMSSAITRLTLVEERVTRNSSGMERAFTQITEIDRRVDVLEKQAVTNKQTSDWVGKALWAAAAAAATFVAKKAGLF